MINTDCVEIFNIKDRVGEQVIFEVRIKVRFTVRGQVRFRVRDRVWIEVFK
jgi:hypothetical protein